MLVFMCICQNPNAHLRPVSQDLAGFWDMLQLSIENISLKFDELHQLKANNWKPLTPPEIQVRTHGGTHEIHRANLKCLALIWICNASVALHAFCCSYWLCCSMHIRVACLTPLLVLCVLLFLIVDSELLMRSHSTCHAPLGPVHLQWSFYLTQRPPSCFSYPSQMASTVNHSLVRDCMLSHYAANRSA